MIGISGRENLPWAKVWSWNSPVGEVSVGGMSIKEVSVEGLSSGSVRRGTV